MLLKDIFYLQEDTEQPEWSVGDEGLYNGATGKVEAIVTNPIEHKQLYNSHPDLRDADLNEFSGSYILWKEIKHNRIFIVKYDNAKGNYPLEKPELETFEIWNHDSSQVILESRGRTSPLKVAIKGHAGKILKGLKGSQGITGAGVLGAFAHDHLKRYKKFKTISNRSLAFYARDVHEQRAYQKMIDNLVKSKQYKIIRSFKYAGGAKMWELRLNNKGGR